jgi:hypothetical protein
LRLQLLYGCTVSRTLLHRARRFTNFVGHQAWPPPKVSGPATNIAMENDIPTDIWIYYCARQLKMHWRTVDPEQLEELAADLARQSHLRQLSPQAAAAKWLEPVLVRG